VGHRAATIGPLSIAGIAAFSLVMRGLDPRIHLASQNSAL
jgi:hypothetical protein